jgi:hypothetical protein
VSTGGPQLAFVGTAAPLNAEGLARACGILGVGRAELRAVLAVEISGNGFLPDGRPKILFERHVFHRLTQGRHSAEHPGISNPERGDYCGSAAEYGRLERAISLDHRAAFDSTSWGLGPIMGFNAVKAGCPDPEAMERGFAQGADAQVAAAARFIAASGAQAHLDAHDWAAFARVYNGPRFVENHYDEKLQRAYERSAEDHSPLGVVDRA